MQVTISISDEIERDEVLAIYRANGWSAAEKPSQLTSALRNSHSLVTARGGSRLVGIGNAISDGHLVVYFPHLLVHPDFHGLGIGRKLMEMLQSRYYGFHQQTLIADRDAVIFYDQMGFKRAGDTVPMWIYDGDDH
jgi:GNAT superfamily N-acetyltransferase